MAGGLARRGPRAPLFGVRFFLPSALKTGTPLVSAVRSGEAGWYTPVMARRLARRGQRWLLFGWRFLPLRSRKTAIPVLYPTFPVGAIAVMRDEQRRFLLVPQTYHRDDCWGAP